MTAPAIDLVLPLPPSANHRYVRRRDGGLALGPAARAYDDVVAAALGFPPPPVPPSTPLAVAVTLTVDHLRRRDLDNVFKQLVDSLSRALAFDDAWVFHLSATKVVVPHATPSVAVTVSWEVSP